MASYRPLTLKTKSSQPIAEFGEVNGSGRDMNEEPVFKSSFNSKSKTGRKPTCSCGECQKCRMRAWVKDWRKANS